MDGELLKFYYHHSSHGQTTLHKLLVDKDRREKIILAKYAIPELAQGQVNFFDLSYQQIYDRAKEIIGDEGIQDLFLKHQEEMGQIPLVDHIEGVPYGKKLGILYKVRGLQGHSVLAGDFSSDPEKEVFPQKEYHNYIAINALGNKQNKGIVHLVRLWQGGKEKVFFDLDQGIAINVPGILHDYIAEFKVGFFELFRDEDEPDDTTLYVSSDESGTPIRYAGASFEMKQNAYLHSFSPDSTELSAINMFMNGTGNSNWDKSIYQRYYGLKREIKPDTEMIMLTIFGSHCLNLQEFNEYGNIGNVIPFMLESSPEWCEMFKKDLYKAAEEEVDYQNDAVIDAEVNLEILEEDNEERELERQDAVLDVTRLLRDSSDQYLLRPRSDSYHTSDLSDLEIDLSIDRDELNDLRGKLEFKRQKLMKARSVLEALQTIQKKGLGPVQSTKRTKKKKKDLSVKPSIKKNKQSKRKKKR